MTKATKATDATDRRDDMTRTAARAAYAELSAALDAARAAGDAALVGAYGDDVTRGTVTLARNVVGDIAGERKTRGGARQRVLDVRAAIDERVQTIAAADVASGAAAALMSARWFIDVCAEYTAARNAAARAEREHRAALRAQANDPSANENERRAAFDELVSNDAARADERDAARRDAFMNASKRAHDSGLPVLAAFELLAAAYGIENPLAA